jgi:penicillin amidase
MRTIRRAALALIAGLLAVILVAAASGAVLLWRTLPPARMEAKVTGLSAPVEITFDADGIPRIRAADAVDAAAALGFVHARDRLFQMELMRRNASGRLAEIVGPAALPIDRMMRVLGLRRHAAADLDALSEPTRAMLAAYARGVNAWIAARGRFSAPEFLLLGTPEPWQPLDSLLWAKTMGLWLSANYRTELARLSLADKLPRERILALWPEPGPMPRPDASLPVSRAYAEAAGRVLAVLPHFPEPFTQPATASNEWAMDGTHAASGAPLLAGDPHLGFGFPPIWYLARIDTPDGPLVGATAPGVPAVVLGHNGHIAWTFTNTGADVQDVFIETPVGTDRYQTPDGPQPFVTHEEHIGVRGRPDEVLTVRETRHGPVISDLDQPGGPLLAVAMANLWPGDIAADGLFELDRATDLDAAATAAGRITAPVQNLLVADRSRIGLFTTGRVPVRRAGDGAMPVEGADGAHDWLRLAGSQELPRIVAPTSGRLVNANERTAPADFPVYLGRDWFGDWRAARIRARLEEVDRHTVESFVAIQSDVESDFARRMLPAMLAATPRQATPRQATSHQAAPADALAARAAELLRTWDGTMSRDRPQPLIFNAWIGRVRTLVLTEAGVPESAAGPALEFVAPLVAPGGESWCGGDCRPLFVRALSEATAALAGRFGPEPAAWRWGDAHRAIFAHPLLRAVSFLNRFAAISIAAPGDDSTVDRGAERWDNFDDVQGPSYRGVYDLADLERSRFVVAPGQSGNLLSRHARDFLRRWRDGDTITIGRVPDSVEATIRLLP